MANLQGWHLIILLVIILLLFGAAKLPALAKSMGQSARAFKGEIRAMKDEDGVADAASETPTATNGITSTLAGSGSTESARPTA